MPSFSIPAAAAVGAADVGAGAAAAAGATAATAGGVAAATGADLAATAGIGAGAASAATAATGGTILSSLPSLSTIGTVASLGGSLLQASGQSEQAKYQEEVAQSEATALNAKANQDAASAERTQITQERQTQLALSRNRAVAAASGGGGSTDPSVLNNAGLIAQQGDFNALSSLYSGQSAARSDTYQAAIDLFRGQQIAAALPTEQMAGILSGISNFAARQSASRSGSTPFFAGV